MNSINENTFRPPLSADELRAIGLRRDPADILALLWEIKRLRATVLRADQLQRSCGGTCSSIVLGALRSELKGEPCIEEQLRVTPKS